MTSTQRIGALSPVRAARACRAAAVVAALLMPLTLGASVPAPVGPPRGSVAPRISLNDLHGAGVTTERLSGRTLVVVFGELGHDGTRQACGETLDAIADQRLEQEKIVPILITAQDRPAAELREQAAQGRFPALILQDPKREAFGAYRILVVPTVVVVDGKGVVVHSMPGFLPRFKEMLVEAMLVSAGRESPEEFDRSLGVQGETPADKESLRAGRLAHLADELARHGLDEMAEARYTEARAISPGNVAASLGLAALKLRQGQLDQAESLYRSVLASHADSTDASLGLAEVNLRRGGDALTQAEILLRSVLGADARQPRAHYLLGLVHEQRGHCAEATAEYRAAAELLLKR
jgi:thioredoxin-like negative regulator of GroEL